jgi:hypothetical protein
MQKDQIAHKEQNNSSLFQIPQQQHLTHLIKEGATPT